MHMADALISPAVGTTMWGASLALMGYSSKKLAKETDKVALMGVLGAFIFAAQMINFTIPATGSSGHLGGGMILSILLGPYAAFLVMASILSVQAFFFADGGLWALGANIFNLGFFPCFIAYPLVYVVLTKGEKISTLRLSLAAFLSSVLALQLGSLGVVLETFFSKITELPFGRFLVLMQAIHLGIGLVEGLVTSAVVLFILKSRPELLSSLKGKTLRKASLKKIIAIFIVLTLFLGGILSWFASSQPDGLEWSMMKTAGKEELEARGGLYEKASALQEKTTLLPDYNFKEKNIKAGTSLSGLLGGSLVFVVIFIVAFILRQKFSSHEKGK